LQQELTTAMAGLAEYRRQRDERRASLAAAAAKPMIAELVERAAALGAWVSKTSTGGL